MMNGSTDEVTADEVTDDEVAATEGMFLLGEDAAAEGMFSLYPYQLRIDGNVFTVMSSTKWCSLRI